MEFYKLFNFRGTIGVNKLTLGDMVGVEIVMLLIYVFLGALFGLIAPTILFGFYVLWMISGNGGTGNDGNAVPQRLYINVFTVVSTLYFLLDFHFGWLTFRVLGQVMSKETYDAVASFNVTLSLLSIVTFFIGHEVYRLGEVWIVRVILFCIALYFGFKFFSPIGDYIVTNLVTQFPR